MEIEVVFIDQKGFMSFRTGKSKKLVKEWLGLLQKGTSIVWSRENQVQVSQQYLKA